jgi:hypothetical protein
MKTLLRAICVLAVSITISGALADHTAAEGQRQIQLDEQLVEVGKKLYDLNSEVPTMYARAFKKNEAGEGLFSRLFDDAITVLSLATKQNPDNLRAQFYLGKAYLAKSYEGEGKWSKALLLKAKEHFSSVLSEGPNRSAPRSILSESKKELESIRKILDSM